MEPAAARIMAAWIEADGRVTLKLVSEPDRQRLGEIVHEAMERDLRLTVGLKEPEAETEAAG